MTGCEDERAQRQYKKLMGDWTGPETLTMPEEAIVPATMSTEDIIAVLFSNSQRETPLSPPTKRALRDELAARPRKKLPVMIEGFRSVVEQDEFDELLDGDLTGLSPEILALVKHLPSGNRRTPDG